MNSEFNTNSNIPKLRFPEFSGEWEKKKINDIVLEKNKKSITNNQFPILSSSMGGIYLQSDYFNKQTASQNNIGYKIIEREDFVYRSMSDTGYFTFNLQNLIDIGIVSPAYPVFKNTKNIKSKYLLYVLNNDSYIKKQILILKEGGTRFALSFSKFAKLKINLPTLPEQQKIASFLESVDSYVNNLRSQKESLEKYKKGIMQKIFAQEIRFKDENGQNFPDWEEKSLGEISTITTGKLDANAMKENGQYRFYTCAKNYFQIDKYAFDTEALLISGNGANVGYIHYYKGKFNAYQRTYVLDNFTSNIIYIKYFLETFLSFRIDKQKNEGNTPYIVLSALKDMIIKLPSLPEQQKIASFLSSLDDQIELKAQQIEKAEEWKKGLMQGLFV